jgi:DNA-binding response OmpR family regulator
MARILVVDDDPDIRRLLTVILKDEGHQVMDAPDGERALEMIATVHPDLIVLDVMMPKKDGYTVLKEMKSSGVRESTKVLVLTARAAEADWLRGYKLGADHYLTKPFETEEFVDVIDDLLEMNPDQLKARRLQELDRAQLLSRLESLFEK